MDIYFLISATILTLFLSFFLFLIDWEGVRNLVQALPPVKRIVLVSSIGVTKFNELPWRYSYWLFKIVTSWKWLLMMTAWDWWSVNKHFVVIKAWEWGLGEGLRICRFSFYYTSSFIFIFLIEICGSSWFLWFFLFLPPPDYLHLP